MSHKNQIYRQGDVLIERIAKIPTSAKKQRRARRVILAHGEVTGHHHCLKTADPADWWKVGDIAPTLDKPSTLAGEIFTDLPEGGTVTHDEHAAIILPPGKFRITRQREYAPEAPRNVMD